MTRQDDDRPLREMFAALRDEDRRALPSFDRMTTRHPGPSPLVGLFGLTGGRLARRGLWVTAAVLVVALAAAVVSIRSRRSSGRDRLAEALAQAESIDSWQAPTDSVLEISLLKIPDTVPTLEFASVALPADTTSLPAPGPAPDDGTLDGDAPGRDSGTPEGGAPDRRAPKPEAPYFPLL